VRLPQPEPDWPKSWRSSYDYDLLELGEAKGGYARAYQRRREVTLELVSLAAPPGATVLDVAAAQGNFSLALAELGYRVTWNDLRAELGDYVRLKRERGDLSFMPGEILQIDPAPHDVVLATEVIEHVAHPDQFLEHLARFTRPGGHVVLTTPTERISETLSPASPTLSTHPHLRLFSFNQMRTGTFSCLIRKSSKPWGKGPD
jgi:2-polyprenyl-3-methyl-5-hydroxy-6-metoxy-1,4-benzoquinol methylase